MEETLYIGRTAAYYDDDDNYVFTPDLWACGDDPAKLAGEIHVLTEEGVGLIDRWLYDLGAGYDLCNGRAQGLAAQYSREEMWNHLTDPKNGLSYLYN